MNGNGLEKENGLIIDKIGRIPVKELEKEIPRYSYLIRANNLT